MADASFLAELFSLTGRGAVVTGAAGLLGRVFASTLGHLGARLILIDQDKKALEQVAEKLQSTASVTLLVGDICDDAWLPAALDGVAGGGSLDVLVNSAAIDAKMGVNAGGTTPRFTDYPFDAFCRSLHVNLGGTFLATREVCKVMEAQGTRGRGTIINVSSTYGIVGPDQRLYDLPGTPKAFKPVDYPTTKAGVIGFTRALAAYYAGSEIRVNALVPGGAYASHGATFVDAYANRTILGRMADPQEYRGPLAFLASEASSYMTGGVLVVDGGWTAW